MFKKFTNKAQEFLENSSDWVDKIFYTDLRDLGQEKIIQLSQNFNKAIPVLEEAGFQLKEVSLNLGVSPTLLAILRMSKYLDEAEEKAILEKYKDQALINWLLPALYKARKMQAKISFHKLDDKEIGVEIGVMPKLILKYQNSSS